MISCLNTLCYIDFFSFPQLVRPLNSVDLRILVSNVKVNTCFTQNYMFKPLTPDELNCNSLNHFVQKHCKPPFCPKPLQTTLFTCTNQIYMHTKLSHIYTHTHTKSLQQHLCQKKKKKKKKVSAFSAMNIHIAKVCQWTISESRKLQVRTSFLTRCG